MNKLYKLVWNEKRDMYVAVPEFAKCHSKKSRGLSNGGGQEYEKLPVQ